MSGDKAYGGKVIGDKVNGVKVGFDKVNDNRISSDKMNSSKVIGDMISGGNMSSDKMNGDHGGSVMIRRDKVNGGKMSVPVRALVKRNLLMYFRNRSAVFYSLMSTFIVIVLMMLFLGNMNVDSLVDVLSSYGKVDGKSFRTQAKDMVLLWEIAGILIVSSVMISLTVLGTAVSDRSEGKLDIFMTAPVGKLQIALGYVLASVLVGVIMCVLTYGVALGYYMLQGGTVPGVFDRWDVSAVLLVHLKVLGVVVGTCCLYSALMYLMVIFVKGNGAWSGLGTIIGTLAGFLGGIYLPMELLPKAVGNVLKCLPILHGAALTREVLMADGLKNLFAGMPEGVLRGYNEAMGIELFWNDQLIPVWVSVAFLAACGIISIVAAALLQRRNR
jgi:multidrug/hemolysin transport system permease protein